MLRVATLSLLAILLTAPALPAQSSAQPPAWQAAIDARRQQLVATNGPGTNAALRDELLSLRDDDQIARGLRAEPTATTGGIRVASNLHEIDGNITARLKDIVQKNGWPTISLVGLDASNAAMLLLNHATDNSWRASLLPQLETLADQKKIDPSQLALVVDKQLIAAGQPQRYGTQFKFVDGEMAMYAVEDPGGLDTLRARTLLPPLDVYKAQLARIYHLKANNKIVSPAAPSAN